MPSLLPGYEYDIFISYRQNDNRSGWVTEFVRALEEELSATIKRPVTVYFDSNPHDGLLETHSVDKSLENKLKSLIFIPILSQTYCDPNSFAWQHEFCAFNKLAKEDSLGRDIKLTNGNVASRILPIRIHDLDSEDKTTIEQEMGGTLRAVDFIFRSAGVNRPLSPADKRDENLDHVFYRDQVNKVANAVKEIVSATKSNNTSKATNIRQTTAPEKSPKSIGVVGLVFLVLSVSSYFLYTNFRGSEGQVLDKSIAVLPFTDMSPGHDQEYLGDGIAEDIITALSKIKGLKVIGRTSSFQFKGEKIDLREIGDKLNVSTLLEGSVMKSRDKLRITAQLINVNDGSHIWSEQYERTMDDVFSIQDEISQMIAAKMKMSISGNGHKADQKPTDNIEAYENLLLGMQLMNRGFENAKAAIPFFEKAIQLDSNYIAAYEHLGNATFFMPFGNEIAPQEAVKKIEGLAQQILKLDPNSRSAHALLFIINFQYNWDWEKAEVEFELARAIDDSPDVGHALYRYFVYNDFKAAEEEFLEIIKLDPLDKEAIRLLGNLYGSNQQPDKALEMMNRAIQIDPTSGNIYKDMAAVYVSIKEYDQAIVGYKKGDALSPRYHRESVYLAALMKSGREQEAMALFNAAAANGASATMYFAVGKTNEGFEQLEKDFANRDAGIIQFRMNSGFDPVRDDPRFIALIKRLNLPK